MKTRVTISAVLLAACLGLLSGSARAPKARTDPAASGSAAVPITVRVYDGERFVTGLGLDDFVIEEAGLALAPRALFFVRRDAIERREGDADFAPVVTRRIVLFFRLTEYHSKIPEALKALFETALLPTDTLEVVTPVRDYLLSSEALATKPRAVLARELADIVRKDIVTGGMAYNNALRDLKRAVRQIGSVGQTGLGDTEGEVDDGTSLEQQLMRYAESLAQMETFRVVEESDLVGFAGRMRGQQGRKLVFFVYQREFRPEISPQALDILTMGNQDRPDILAALQTVFPLYGRPINLNPVLIRQAFADSGMGFHFLYMNRQPERISGITMREQSEDVYKALSGAAEATGGSTDSSQNPATSLAKALKAEEAAYILLFTPATAAPPGTFIDLEVRIKGRDYRITHRAGYLAGS